MCWSRSCCIIVKNSSKMMLIDNFVTVALLLLAQPSVSFARKTGKSHKNETSPSLNFIAIGDWGGVGSLPLPFHHQHQTLVASGMAKVALEANPEFVISLGDNFYLTGVHEHSAEKRFNQTFVAVYNDPVLSSIPWYVIAGNHDHYGDVQAQIRYTYHESNTNKRWNFPSLYHRQSFSRTMDNVTVTLDVVLIDTVDLCSLAYFFPLPLRDKHAAADNGKQWQWLEDTLSSSQADYVLVAGHYPVYSICSHGPTPTLVRHLKPLLEQYEAHYIAGHEHGMMHWREPDSAVNYVVSGTGSYCCCQSYASRKSKWNPKEEDKSLRWSMVKESQSRNNKKKVKGGFVSFQVDKKSMVIKYHDQNGRLLYEADRIAPRTTRLVEPLPAFAASRDSIL